MLALDGARAIAVVAMVFGHTFSALISPAGMQVPWVTTYWHVRAFTSPLFLFVSGWVLFFVITRRGLSGTAVFRAYLPRVALLFTLGYLLRFPIWDLGGLLRLDAQLWRYFATFDALQCIAAAMLVTLFICAWIRRTWVRVALLSSFAGIIALSAPWVWRALGGPTIPGVVAQTFGGGESLFPFFPWTAYFFAGASVGAVVQSRASSPLRLAAIAAVATAVAFSKWPWAHLPPTEVMRFVGGIAIVSCVVTGALLLPRWLNHSLAGVGRASLWAYVMHLPVVYGWGYWHGMATRVGPILDDREALLVAVAMVLATVSVSVLAQRRLGGGRWKLLGAQAFSWALRRLGRQPPVKDPLKPARPV
ncbi:MAG: DUF1624 domain-containing protein [Myxococcota bacterium]|nr:DUF1624 domain-containing protein [Myxococcota bacterium]